MAAVLGGAVIIRTLMKLIGQPDHMSQVFDNVFHLNSIRYIMERENASSLTLGSSQGQAPIYPASWHTFARWPPNSVEQPFKTPRTTST